MSEKNHLASDGGINRHVILPKMGKAKLKNIG